MCARSALALLLGVVPACSVGDERFDRSHLSDALVANSGHGIAAAVPAAAEVPPEVGLDDGVDEEEAVALALWNNADFQSAIAELGIARARLVEAGLLQNPTFSILFPLGPKQLEFTLTAPLEALWLRPGRVAAAELDCEHIATLLVQGGLDPVRDVRVAFADLGLARDRAALAADEVELLRRTADLFAARFAAGDVGEREADDAAIDVLDAERARRIAEQDVTVAEERLRSLIGFQLDRRGVEFAVPEPGTTIPDPPAGDQLLSTALATRPDVRAAELLLEAAGRRAGLAESEWLRLSAILDANGQGKEGFEMGPGLAFEVPLFHQADGRIAITRAELEVAATRYVAVCHRVAREIADARAGLERATRDLSELRDVLLPAVAAARDRAAIAHEIGDVSRLDLLVAERRVLATRGRIDDARAALGRARAELERSIGRRTAPTETRNR